MPESAAADGPLTSVGLSAALDRTLGELFEMMLGIERCRAGCPQGDDHVQSEGDPIEAWVELMGSPGSAVRLVATGPATLEIAARLLSCDAPAELGGKEVRDALGECANILAGGLKAKLFDPRGEWRRGTSAVASLSVGSEIAPDKQWISACPAHIEPLAAGAIVIEVFRQRAVMERHAA